MQTYFEVRVPYHRICKAFSHFWAKRSTIEERWLIDAEQSQYLVKLIRHLLVYAELHQEWRNTSTRIY